ncbi:MAG: polyhydroxyalkanoate synthesis repressor PhaR [Rhodospirillales bacterium]|nr:polyhydroxyalkanoate synthesis repressor PhaR [Alphaproteobacteria bacterium]MCB1839842.1 polyhydroxyalkanoate synthesis repressor PhaR [Alphaproteobacteria bacterium]MCB9976051.1 polyhydroxyalkanoate synthesis repressor PhaR [Rhodospirillales bacterium]
MAKTRNGKDGPTIIKKYANRRLYDTGRSSYVTLDDLCEMVKEGHEFVVQDAKSGKDITRSVLTQIIVDQESQGETLLPTNFLRTLIGFYGDKIQNFIPGYLEQTLDVFVKNQERIREQVNKSFEGMRSMEGMFPPIPTLEEMRRQNMEMFEKTMKMMSPFGNPYTPNTGDDKTKKNK